MRRRRLEKPLAISRCWGAAIYLVTGLPLRLMRQDHQICSGLVVRALQTGGLLPGLDPSLTLPADLAKLFDARP